ncbi:MAG: hypothetical protein K2Y37_16485 [Pirellulales bacterium]|nr:hypothetical protein [Pirellulales bacterium]
MDRVDPQFVAKVHPLTRDAAVEDPLELVATPVAGDPAVMLECILQEFAWMGWGAEQLLGLFYHPGYPLLCELRAYYGDDEIRRQVEALVAQWGVLQFRETIVEDDDNDEDHLQLVQIQMPTTTAGPCSRETSGDSPIDLADANGRAE